MQTTTMTSKGQVTVPKEVRLSLGLRQGSRIVFAIKGDHAVLRPATPERLRPKSGFGMIAVAGAAVPADFDVATLLEPAAASTAKVRRKVVK